MIEQIDQINKRIEEVKQLLSNIEMIELAKEEITELEKQTYDAEFWKDTKNMDLIELPLEEAIKPKDMEVEAYYRLIKVLT